MSDLPFPPADPGLGLGLSLPEIHAEFPHRWPGPPSYSGHGWPGGPESWKCRYQEPRAPGQGLPPCHSAPDPPLWVGGEGAPDNSGQDQANRRPPSLPTPASVPHPKSLCHVPHLLLLPPGVVQETARSQDLPT